MSLVDSALDSQPAPRVLPDPSPPPLPSWMLPGRQEHRRGRRRSTAGAHLAHAARPNPLPGKSGARPPKSSVGHVRGPRPGAPGAGRQRAHQLGAQPDQGALDARPALLLPRRLRRLLLPRAPRAAARHRPLEGARQPPPEVFQQQAGGWGLLRAGHALAASGEAS